MVTIIDSGVFGTANLDIDNNLIYIPNQDEIDKTETIHYVICDHSLCDTASVQISITYKNLPPVVNNDFATVNEDGNVFIEITANDQDPNNDVLLVTKIIESPLNGSALIWNSNAVNYIPNAEFSGQDMLTVKVCDTAAVPNCDTSSVFITVKEVNDPLTINTDTIFITMYENESIKVDVSNNYTDIDNVSINVSVNNVVNGFTPSVGSIIEFKSMPGFDGIAFLNYSICDNGQPISCDNGVVKFTVLDIDTATVTTGILDSNGEKVSLIVSPTPTTNNIYLSFNGGYNVKYIEITDISGKVVLKREVVNDNFIAPYRISLEKFDVGMYFANVYLENGHKLRERILKQ